MLFQLVVGPAFSVDVAGAGQAALVERDAMVEIALLSGPPAGRVPAGLIPGGDQLYNPPRRPVRGRGQIVGAPAGSLVVLAALLGRCGLPPCRGQSPVYDLRERRARRGRPCGRRSRPGRRGTVLGLIGGRDVSVMLCQLINPDD
jgi:hypothetical protein